VRRHGRTVVLVAAVAVVFALGVGLGQALHDGSRPDGTQTLVRTLAPQPVEPARETVTVTVTAPQP
jgi:hypothetical protein